MWTGKLPLANMKKVLKKVIDIWKKIDYYNGNNV